MQWIGIDEAGYGPNLGPLVMAAVVVETEDDRKPDVWGDLPGTIGRVGSGEHTFWVDDSKALYQGGRGRDRLEAAALATLDAAGLDLPGRFSEWLAAVGAGSLDSAELSPWLEPGGDPVVPRDETRARLAAYVGAKPLTRAPWKVVGVRAEVVGPRRFNEGITGGGSKATAHFDAFARLLRPIWERSDGQVARARCDKHGGRHYYLGPLSDAFPDAWIDRGEEGPSLSQYVLKDASKSRHLELSITPRADADDGLVALASIVAKSIRETWMDAFNTHWMSRIPGLRPTAGYPVDAARFREAIEPICRDRGLDLADWWRSR